MNTCSVHEHHQHSQTYHQQYPNILIRLSPIPLSSFHSKLNQWVFFLDSFEFMINRNESLINFERIHYLKFVLKKEEMLKSLTISDDNYLTVWKLLRERYNQSLKSLQEPVVIKHSFDAYVRNKTKSINNWELEKII